MVDSKCNLLQLSFNFFSVAKPNK
uniref:Uncharacterized protein n=1 Tax=Rhizophora mucronata TaxID=61149 RepID=A0A2P2NT78_RHIMU